MADDSDLPTPNVPARLDHAALERVLKRAAELQAAEADPADATLTEEQLVEVGREVGLAPQHLRQALAEERSRSLVPQEDSTLAHLFGPAIAHASRTVRATPENVFAALDLWLAREHILQVKRRFPDRMLWEPRSGFLSEFQRAFNVGGHGYHLSKAHEVAATVVRVDDGRVLVRLEANLTNVRVQRVASGGALFGGGALGSATLVALGFFAPVAAIPAAAAVIAGYFVARSHVPVVARAPVEELLERGELPRPSLLSTFGATIR